MGHLVELGGGRGSDEMIEGQRWPRRQEGGRREMKVTGRELRYKRVRGALAGRIKRRGATQRDEQGEVRA